MECSGRCIGCHSAKRVGLPPCTIHFYTLWYFCYWLGLRIHSYPDLWLQFIIHPSHSLACMICNRRNVEVINIADLLVENGRPYLLWKNRSAWYRPSGNNQASYFFALFNFNWNENCLVWLRRPLNSTPGNDLRRSREKQSNCCLLKMRPFVGSLTFPEHSY